MPKKHKAKIQIPTEDMSCKLCFDNQPHFAEDCIDSKESKGKFCEKCDGKLPQHNPSCFDAFPSYQEESTIEIDPDSSEAKLAPEQLELRHEQRNDFQNKVTLAAELVRMCSTVRVKSNKYLEMCETNDIPNWLAGIVWEAAYRYQTGEL